MMPHRLHLTILPAPIAICRLDAQAALPAWATAAAYWSITRTPEELSIVCLEACLPVGVSASRDWRAIKLDGPHSLDQPGILSSVTAPLAAARVSVFSLATFDTDYLLIPAAQRPVAIAALEGAGHTIGSAGF